MPTEDVEVGPERAPTRGPHRPGVAMVAVLIVLNGIVLTAGDDATESVTDQPPITGRPADAGGPL